MAVVGKGSRKIFYLQQEVELLRNKKLLVTAVSTKQR